MPTDAIQMKLELTWPNKDKFLLVPNDDAGRPVWVERNHPAASEVRLTDFTTAYGAVNDDNPHSDNLMFTGDSLDVLRNLAQSPEYRREYRGKVKLVYIDPPFNTGQTFEHYDDWMEHSTWLSFMHDRLKLIHELLTTDGTVWVHLDNFEIHRMRCLMDDIFGAENYINTVVWKRTSGKSAARRGMGTMCDNILIYGRSEAASLNPILMPYTDEYLRTKYGNSDERGFYTSDNLTATGIRKGDSGLPWRGYDPAARGNHWRAPQAEALLGVVAKSMTTREKLEGLLADGYIQLPKNDGGAPRFRRYLNPDGGVALGDLWADISVLNSQAKERCGYDTQKPEKLLERVLTMGTEPGDVVLDVFAGSGTTAAVAHKMGRRWITADILASTIDGFTRPRMERIVNGNANDLVEVLPTFSVGGFRSVTIAPSMYEVTDFGVVLADWATNGRFSRAVAGQLGFEWQADESPFCGTRGQMRLAVLDGVVGPEEARQIASGLDDGERVTIVAKVLLEGAEAALREVSPGSRVRKAPRDLLTRATRRALHLSGGAA